METYHKIQTVFLRDPETKFKALLEGQFAKPEFEFLKDTLWEWTEKVDGMNIRVTWDGTAVKYFGKTDAATIHPDLFTRLQELFPADKLRAKFGNGCAEDDLELREETKLAVCLYGEGFGAGIQKGGDYQQQKDFILFDVKIGDYWLERSSVEDIANTLGCRIVPIMKHGTLLEAVEFARTGYKSVIAENTDLVAEGLILKPTTPLYNKRGERVISKIKFRDFKK